MTTPTPGALRPLSDRLADALTIALSATDLLEQLALGRLERSLENLNRVAESLHQAASLTSPNTHPNSHLKGISTALNLAGELVRWIDADPALLTPDRQHFILATLYGAADKLAMIDLANTANRTEAHG